MKLKEKARDIFAYTIAGIFIIMMIWSFVGYILFGSSQIIGIVDLILCIPIIAIDYLIEKY